MNIVRIPFLILLLSATIGCLPKNTPTNPEVLLEEPKMEVAEQQKNLDNYETAYFAAGCFWCVEAIFESVKGVEEVVSGYSGGSEKDPSYEDVAYGRTGHAEAVVVYYDPKIISFKELVQVFFGSHDPTSLNRQGPDKGPQYRSIAFYKNADEKKMITDYIALLESKQVFDRPIVTQVVQYKMFYEAEKYHQDFEKRNPNNSYVRNVSIPRLNRFKKNFQSYLKEDVH